MKGERHIIIAPLMTEKMSALQEDQNKVAFVVDRSANKIEIKRAVESRFNVKIDKVSTVNMMGKTKKMGRFEGRRSNWKKAVVTLKEGFKIDFFEGK
ncbi:MAG TPA: 50S ribosomal protein L23 [bacterium]|nr:50S ribosomal protein L23 [bacterium]